MPVVGVNLLWCRPGEVGGSEQYLVRQLVGLLDDPGDVEPVLFALPPFRDAHPELAGRAPMVVARHDGSSRPRRVLTESTWLARQVRSRRLPLVHHGGGTAPLDRGGARTVLTIHDLQYLTYPATFSTPKLAYLRWAVPRSVGRADVVTCPSEYVKRTVMEAFGHPDDRVVVVPHGIPDGEAALHPPTAEADLRARYALPGPFVLYPAITYPHKNHLVLVEAMAALRHLHPDLRLVLLGGQAQGEAALQALVAERGVGDVVVRPGRVSAADRDGLYACATAVAFPSRYEGFGAPVLEAMRAGCPVVCADATALPEVVGDAAIRCAPLDTDAWVDAIHRVTGDPLLRAELADAGRRRGATFTAARSAAALQAAYRRALA